MRFITAALMAGVLAAGGVARAQDVPSGKMKDRLSAMRITLDFSNAKLDEVIAYFQEFTGFNFHLDPAARAKEEDSRISIKLKDVTVMTALKLILKPRELGCVHRDGVIVIASKASLGTQTVTRIYETRDLSHGLMDFAGPRMELSSPGAGQALAGAIFIEEEPTVTLPADVLADLVKANTGGASWEDSSATSITMINGLLIITQSKPVHDEIQALLDQLRQYK
jgi:hypothetical protein